jgi:AcrR family transcriptional regulator
VAGNRTGFDFGLSGLSGTFHADVRLDASLREQVLTSAEAEGSPRMLLDDVLRLLESPLPDWALTSLWHAATGRNHRLDLLGVTGRDWLGQIAEVCVELIRHDEPTFAAGPPTPIAETLTGAVLDELLLVGPALTRAVMVRGDGAVSGAVPALERVVAQVDPDLGFRLLLRALDSFWVPVERAQYDRMRALGERFGYGEFLVSGIDFLVGLGAD